MTPSRFVQAMDGLQRLLNMQCVDLKQARIVEKVESDGLPKDWVEDIALLSHAQTEQFIAVLDKYQPAWASTLTGYFKEHLQQPDPGEEEEKPIEPPPKDEAGSDAEKLP